jgi:hypothetical protein
MKKCSDLNVLIPPNVPLQSLKEDNFLFTIFEETFYLLQKLIYFLHVVVWAGINEYETK